MVRLDPQTQTLYTANAVDGDVSVIDPTRCDAQNTSGCRAARARDPTVGGYARGWPPIGGQHDLYPERREYLSLDGQCQHLQRLPRRRLLTDAADGSQSARSHSGRRLTRPPTLSTSPTREGGEGACRCSTTVPATRRGADRVRCRLSFSSCPTGSPDDVEVNPATDTVYVAAIASTRPEPDLGLRRCQL